VIKDRVARLLEALAPQTFADRVKLLVVDAPWDHEEQANGKLRDIAAEKAERFAAECAQHPEDLLPHLGLLVTGRQNQGLAFGRSLGERVSNPRALLDGLLLVMRATPSRERAALTVGGVLTGVETRDPALVREFMGVVAADELLQGSFIDFTRFVTIEPYILDHIKALVAGGRLPVMGIELVATGRAIERLPPDVVVSFLDAISRTGADGLRAAISLIAWYLDAGPLETIAQVARAIVLTPGLFSGTAGAYQMDDYHLKKVVVAIIDCQAHDADLHQHLIEEARRWCEAADISYAYRDALHDVLSELLTRSPQTAWPFLSETLVQMDARARSVAAHLLEIRDFEGMGHDATLLSRVPGTDILRWCATHPKIAPAFVVGAGAFPLLDSDGGAAPRWTDVVESLLEKYGHERAVLSALEGHIHTFSWRGASAAPYYRSYLKPLESLLGHGSPIVRSWAAEQMASLKLHIENSDSRAGEWDMRYS
jgi:hypothetical protein